VQMESKRFSSIDRRWSCVLRGFVFVPASAEHALRRLQGCGTSEFVAELHRLAALGTAWAGALLGYDALLLHPDGSRDLTAAVSYCSAPAAKGDALAQYVLAWALLLSGKTSAAGRELKKSALQLFPPALLDVVTFRWNGWAATRTRDSSILVSLRHARDIGHVAAMYWRSSLYRTGNFGMPRRVIGYVLMPVASCVLAFGRWRHPFSATVFVFNARAHGPLFT